MKEYRVCCKEHGIEHTAAVNFRDWGGRQNWQGNATDEEREQAALEWLDEHRRFSRIFYGIKECDMWLEVREVSAWQEAYADGGTVAETYIHPAEDEPICPMPKASVIFEGQKLTFDDEDSAKFAEIVERHFRKLAGLEDT
ncbi:MAG: hypothetical protein J6S63_06855 [Atopobiaceae bacterium]|nr:hypothetical protein [Atopobiaceae bacterium]